MQLSEKILRIDLCDSEGNVLLEIDKNYSFPRLNDRSSDSDMLMVKGTNLPVFPKNKKIFLIIYTKAGDRVQYNCAVGVSTDSQLNLLLRISLGKLLEERRRYFKIDCAAKCRVFAIERDGERTELKNPILGTATNINLGGIFLEISSQGIEFSVEDVLMVGLPEVIKTTLQARILRVQVSSTGELQGYGCCFTTTNPVIEQALAQYINKLQMEKRKAIAAQRK